jgi:hypothetical protein
MKPISSPTGIFLAGHAGLAAFALLLAMGVQSRIPAVAREAGKDSSAKKVDNSALPLVRKYCFECHSTAVKKSGLDLQRFAAPDDLRQDIKPWEEVVERLGVGDMPPEGRPQPTSAERQRIIAWIRGVLDSEASLRSGDPGYVPMRRLSNAEYNYTIRDLTGVDLQPAREFPADGAAGEGFTNAAEALTDISPALLSKYFSAAKDIADHAVLLPDGFRLSPGKTRRDWINESTARLREFLAAYTAADGKLPFQPFVMATVRYRADISAGKLTLGQLAAKEKLNAKYLAILWTALNGTKPSYPLSVIRARWRKAKEADVPALAAEITAWQGLLWKVVKVGSYIYPLEKSYAESTARQIASNPPPTDAELLKLVAKSMPGQSEEALKLAARELKSATGTMYPWSAKGFAEFRNCFPLYLSFPQVIPNDEAVSLKMFHREDEPLSRLFLDDNQARQLDRLWTEHRFISRQPVAENNYLPLFIGFVTQDQPKEMVAYFESQRPAFRARAEAFEKEERAAIPWQLQALLDFASRAYRRPLREKEKTELLSLHQAIQLRGASHDEAFRGVLTRILVSPAFLFRVEESPPGTAAGPISDWELATRLSYFLWASMPDAELRRLAAAGRLHDPQVLSEQAARMLQDDRVRALAIEFGAQWLHVRGFDELNEKNEKLFPTFDAELRRMIYEETVLFFQDLFQSDRRVLQIVDADYTFLNGALAKHYGVPGITGPQWRRVTGVKEYGRGGVLGLASILTKESGASRSSPILRGNWVVETLLGEKLPRPPPNVPRLPEEEGRAGLTMRQEVEKHTRAAQCAVCHQRIDPFGFALEKYDPIGRYRQKDLGGLTVDAKAKLKDGTEFEGIEGLRSYLLTRKKDVFERLFCRRLLGYALGRAVTLSDEPLLTTIVSGLKKNDGRISAAVKEIVHSPQFRMIRGRDFVVRK